MRQPYSHIPFYPFLSLSVFIGVERTYIGRTISPPTDTRHLPTHGQSQSETQTRNKGTGAPLVSRTGHSARCANSVPTLDLAGCSNTVALRCSCSWQGCSNVSSYSWCDLGVCYITHNWLIHGHPPCWRGRVVKATDCYRRCTCSSPAQQPICSPMGSWVRVPSPTSFAATALCFHSARLFSLQENANSLQYFHSTHFDSLK